MRWVVSILLTLSAAWASADDLMIFKLSSGQNVAIRTGAGGVELVGVFENVAVIEPNLPPTPIDEPTGPGQLICVRPWSCTLDESDADLTIRESLDAAGSKIPYLRLLPGTLDQRMQGHPAEKYRALIKDSTRAWVFHVTPTAGRPRILHQGPLDAASVLGWVGVKRVAFADAVQPDEAKWLDVDFSKQQPAMTGALEPPEWLARWFADSAVNVKTLPGFTPVPKSEWSKWTSRFPVSRLAKSIRNITEQTMGSCVGHSYANGVEGAAYMQAGDLFFRRLSGMSMYVRIGRSPNSGAYVGDAADEIYGRGVLPCEGEPYPATFPPDTDFYRKLPAGWESVAEAWKCQVYTVDDQESAFRLLMDLRLRTHFGRSSHAISGFAVTASNKWAYENSWGDDWGDLGKSVGYDSKFYDAYTYVPVMRDEIPVLMARELDATMSLASGETMSVEVKKSPHLEAYRHFDEKLSEIQSLLEEIRKQKSPSPSPAAQSRQPQLRGLFQRR